MPLASVYVIPFALISHDVDSTVNGTITFIRSTQSKSGVTGLFGHVTPLVSLFVSCDTHDIINSTIAFARLR